MSLLRSFPRSTNSLLRMCFFALLGLGLLTPGIGRAGQCGWYSHPETRFDQERTSVTTTDLSSDTDSMPGPIPVQRCKGSFCSAPSPVAPSVPVGTVNGDGEQWLCPIDLLSLPPARSFLVEPDTTVRRPIGRGMSVFHPPRLLLSHA